MEMDIIGIKVKHIKFGEGTIKEISGSCVVVAFEQSDRTFAYPSCFQTFLSSENQEFKTFIQSEIKKEEEEKEAKAQLELQQREAQRKKIEERERQQNKKLPSRKNIAFKCNYCDGGKQVNGIGFYGCCSDCIIKNNIEHRRYSSCTSLGSPCKAYLEGRITRDELLTKDNLCYESQMFVEWKASAGMSYKTGKPESIRNAQINSLCVLTTRDPDDEREEDRYIFGAFIVDEIFEGSEQKEGYVKASDSSPYKIRLTADEAHRIKFWDYYQNRNNPEEKRWGQGLFRYLDCDSNPQHVDNIAVAILQAIVEVKKGKSNERLAENLLAHFCEVNRIKL